MAEDTIDEPIATSTQTSQTETQPSPNSGEKTPDNQPRPLPNSIEIGDTLDDLEYHQGLAEIAETNQITQSWSDLQVAIKNAILQQCELIEKKEPAPEEWANIESIKTNILHSLENHERPPFTVQRLCELVIDPRKHYRMFLKYINAIEKVLLVTSTWDDFVEHSGTNGVSEVPTSLSEGLFATEDSMINGVELEPITFENNSSSNDEDGDDDDSNNDKDKEYATMSEGNGTPPSNDDKNDSSISDNDDISSSSSNLDNKDNNNGPTAMDVDG
ncbi:PPP4R2-domain-containing protein [Zychaea mexicana]|uniref:PPP4R2-domain-containing protein n=1 Tax=Zychaea mexicana TaxID=64656 RepID=UPI0022FEB42A|nr:PPP4R2-domain-containing protein [Zychaea mexicana]KAI9498166.1 PPP4R2-domain-containing protein [Zychaea mexicana]